MMGAKANKALGLGAQRGRLYMKHQDVFRYCGDAEDKLWLYEQGLMPSAGGRAFLLLLEDIQYLAKTDEYRDAPGVEVRIQVSEDQTQFFVGQPHLLKAHRALDYSRLTISPASRFPSLW